ncbi:MAG: hypothetical protein ACRC62_01795 [Microcoleus sp.]
MFVSDLSYFQEVRRTANHRKIERMPLLPTVSACCQLRSIAGVKYSLILTAQQ